MSSLFKFSSSFFQLINSIYEIFLNLALDLTGDICTTFRYSPFVFRQYLKQASVKERKK